MVVKSAFGGGPIAVDFMWSSGTGSEDGFASPPSPMFSVILLLLVVAVFHDARARLMKSVGDPILFLFQKWEQKHNLQTFLSKTTKQISPRVFFSLAVSHSFALKLGEEREHKFSRPLAKFRRL